MPKYGKQAAGFYLSKTHKKYRILSEVRKLSDLQSRF